jgi:hypothetical protein
LKKIPKTTNNNGSPLFTLDALYFLGLKLAGAILLLSALVMVQALLKPKQLNLFCPEYQ